MAKSGPGTGTPRVFGSADAKHLSLVVQLASLGVPLPVAEAVWRGASGPADLYGVSSKVVVLLPGGRATTYAAADLVLTDLPPVAVVIRLGALYAVVDEQLAARAAL